MTKNKLYWHYGASIFLLMFTVIAYFVKGNITVLAGIDQPIIQLIRGSLTPSKTTYFLYITKFGNTVTVILLTALIAGVLYYYKHTIAAYWLLLNIVIIQGIGNFSLKLAFDRPRPTVEHLVQASHSSFPSGHAMGSMLLYGTLILLLPKLIEHRGMRYTCQIILGLLILMVGTSRIYLGVHYPTDILGGFSLSLAWLCFSYPFYKKYDFIESFEGKK